jgi:hypothetical protein
MQVRASGVLLILIFTGMALGTVFLHDAGSQNVASASEEQPVDSIALSSARDFLYASLPQSPTEDSVLITAQLYMGGKPLKKAGIPVDFSLSDGRFATLDQNRVYTDEWGIASTSVRSYNSGLLLPDRPFLLSIKASAEGKSAQITLPMTGYISLGGTVRNKKGDPVEGATVLLAYNRTRVPIKASGSTTTTDVNGKYRLDRVPTDLGDIVVYVKKGDLETSMPADFSSTSSSVLFH